MMLNYEFIGDFMQTMVDLLVPPEGKPQDEPIDGTPDDPSPADRDTENPDVEQEADSEPRYDNESDSDVIERFQREWRDEQDAIAKRTFNRRYPGGE